jgi:hypothetical protein
MADIAFILTADDGSSITFEDVELPQSVAWGGEQAMAVHQLIGGDRVIDSLGAKPAPIAWDGILFGQTAVERARYLDTVRQGGAAVVLTWDEFAYVGVISRFSANYLQPWHVRYSITIEVMRDTTSAQTTAPQESLLAMLNNDTASASCLGNLIGDSTLTGLLGSVSSAVQSLNSVVEAATAPIAAATSCIQQATATAQSALSAIVQPLSQAQTRVQQLMGSVDNAVADMQGLASGAFNGATPQAIQSITTANMGFANAQPVYALNSVLGRMQSNISAGLPGASAKMLAINGGNLQSIAAQQYGDATLWTSIAKVNGLSDPNLPAGAMTLQIPSPAVANGGL